MSDEDSFDEWIGPFPANMDAKVFANWMQNISATKTGFFYPTFKAVEMKSQVEADNYLIKVHVGGDDYVHLMVSQSDLQGDTITTKFIDAKGGYKKDSPLNPDDFGM